MNMRQKLLLQAGFVYLFLIFVITFIHIIMPEETFFVGMIFIFSGLFLVMYWYIIYFYAINLSFIRLRAHILARKLYLEWKDDYIKLRKGKK